MKQNKKKKKKMMKEDEEAYIIRLGLRFWVDKGTKGRKISMNT